MATREEKIEAMARAEQPAAFAIYDRDNIPALKKLNNAQLEALLQVSQTRAVLAEEYDAGLIPSGAPTTVTVENDQGARLQLTLRPIKPNLNS